MMVEVITFDLYGTLVDWKHSISRALNYIHEGLVDAFFDEEYNTVKKMEEYVPYSNVLVEVLKKTLGKYGVEYREEYGKLIVILFAKSTFFPDALVGLSLLKRYGYRTGTISNTDRGLIEITLAGVRDLFDYIVTAEDTGYYKPDKRVFIKAYNSMNVEKEKALHVSAYPQYDLEPADQLGIKTVCVDRYGYDWKEKIPSIDKILERLTVRP